jgi:integrase
MASLQRRSSGLYLLSFRFDGRPFQRSLETSDADEASLIRKSVERRLKLLTDGTLQLPRGAAPDDLWKVLLYGRLPEAAPKLITSVSLGAAATSYLKSYPPGSKEPETLKTERVHLNNFERILGKNTAVHRIDSDQIGEYIKVRLAERGNRGGFIKPDTVRKELQTFRLMWAFARQNGKVFGDCPVDDIKRPKRRIKPPFQTWEQISSAIERGGLSDEQIAELWDGLFLREAEVAEFLENVRQASEMCPRFPYIHPAICFCAYTGARRSEMFRTQPEDIADGWIKLREKKRDRDATISYRFVPAHRELMAVVECWLESHPGGSRLFCKNNREALDDRTSREAFEAVTANSKWSVLRGFHCMRHSFASNLARSGRVTQAEIDTLLGHQTEEMRRRYRHLFPEDKRRAVECLSYKLTHSV